MDSEIKEIFKNFDIDEGVYILNGLKLKLRDLSVDEYERLQDWEAKLQDIENTTMKASEALKIKREFDTVVVNLAFDDVKIDDLKKKCNAKQYNDMVKELFVFLGRFTGIEGVRDFITTLTEKKDLIEKKKDTSS